MVYVMNILLNFFFFLSNSIFKYNLFLHEILFNDGIYLKSIMQTYIEIVLSIYL